MPDPIYIEVDNVTCRLFNGTNTILKEINEICSYFVNGYKYSEAYRRRLWDGKKHRFSLTTKKFPTGLLYRVKKTLEQNNFPYQIVDVRPKPRLSLTTVAQRLEKYDIYPRPYQFSGIEKGLQNHNMMFWWPTASGKTILFGGLIIAYNTTTLILVSRKDLLSQHVKFLRTNTNLSIGAIGDGIWQPAQITVALTQSLWLKRNENAKSKKELLKFLQGINYLIIDEAHHGDAKTYRKPADDCKNSYVRHGFSGTPYSLTADDIELESITGPVLSKVSIGYLIKHGYLSIPVITMNSYDTTEFDHPSWQTVYSRCIVNCKERNNIGCEIIKQRYNDDLLVLVTVQYVKHGYRLVEMLKTHYGIPHREIAYLSGSDEQFYRDKVKKEFIDGKIRVVIVTNIWNEGVDIPTANALVKMDGGGGRDVYDEKGVRSTIQQLGRVLRKEKPPGMKDVDTKTPQYAYVDDFVDAHNLWLHRHSINRLKTYEIEKEFKIQHRSW